MRFVIFEAFYHVKVFSVLSCYVYFGKKYAYKVLTMKGYSKMFETCFTTLLSAIDNGLCYHCIKLIEY